MIAAEISGIRLDKLSSLSAVDQDLRIVGDDVTDFVEALAKEFGEDVLQWPWQRFADLNKPNGLIVFVFFWRLVTWPFRGPLFDPSPFERLELGHIAKVIDAGHWLEP